MRVIASDHDTNVMASVAGWGASWDDVVANPVANLPKVLSPRKVHFVDKKPGEKLPVFYIDLTKGRVEQGPSNQEHEEDDSGDSEREQDHFLDSDYEIEGGDDDLFEANVDMDVKSVKDNKKSRIIFLHIILS